MNLEISELRKRTVSNIITKQDEQFRWAFDEQVARERPELILLAQVQIHFLDITITSRY
jgi:hypothetical protein